MSFWDRLVEELRSLGESIVEWVIILAVALVILIIGRWILKWVRTIVEKVLSAESLQGVWDRSGVTKALESTSQTPASIIGALLYAYLMVVLWLIVVRVLQIATIEVLLARLVAWIPLLLVAAAIVIIAAAAASWTADLVRPFAQKEGVPWLAWLIHIAIVVFGLLFALDLLDITFAEDVVKIIIAALGVAVAIAFGVGGIDAAKQWWAKYGTPGAGSAPKPMDSSTEHRHDG